MKNNIVICISRECGCCGTEIAAKIADKYSIPYYDKEQITKAVKEKGISEDLFDAVENQNVNSFLFSIVNNVGKMTSASMVSMTDRIFLIINDYIKKIASQGSCVILGRCADFILRENDNVIKIFICANIEERVKVIMKRNNIDERKAKDFIKKTDRSRAAYYNYYTGEKWGSRNNHDLIINSALLGVDGTVDVIDKFIVKFDENQSKN